MNTAPDRDKLLELKRHLSDKKLSANDVERALVALRERGEKVTAVDVRQSLEISTAVARNSNDEQWLSFVKDGKLPDVVPLTAQQMEAAKGGLPFLVVCLAWALIELATSPTEMGDGTIKR